MRRRKLLKRIAAEAKYQGVSWGLEREGARHSLYRLGASLIPVPRHNEIIEGLIRKIYTETEAELGEGWWR